MLEAAQEQLADDRRPEAEHPPRPQVRRRVQAARGHARRPDRHAARRARLRVPRPPDLDRDPADPRLPRAEPALVRRPRQLLHGRPRADHLPRDRLRQRSTRSAGSTSRSPPPPQTDAEAFALLDALGMPFARDGRPDGFESLDRPSPSPPRETKRDRWPRHPRSSRMRAPAEVQDAGALALPPVRSPARRLPQVRPVPDLPARARAQRLHPRHDEVELVSRMSMTDPIADFLTRIRNGIMAAHETVEIPSSQAQERDGPHPHRAGLHRGLRRGARRARHAPRDKHPRPAQVH